MNEPMSAERLAEIRAHAEDVYMHGASHTKSAVEHAQTEMALLAEVERLTDENKCLSSALNLAQTRAKDLEAEKSRLCEMIIDERAAHKELDEAIAGENARLRAELEAAKRKDMPTPPTRKWGCTYVCPPDCGGADGDEYGWLPLCPTCGYTSELWEHDKRCPDCGQLIDWTSDWRGPTDAEREAVAWG